MTKRSIPLDCGHLLIRSFSGSSQDVNYQYALWRIQPCQECERLRALDAAKNAEAGLPALTGTLPEIEQASVIRHRKLQAAEKWIAEKTPQGTAIQVAQVKECLERAKQRTEASWWIERADYSGVAILMTVFLK